MPELTEHQRDELVVSGPIHSPFPYAYIAACNQAKITFIHIATMAVPHLLISECQGETYAVPEQEGQALQYLIPKERHIPIPNTYDSTNLHGGGMLCAQACGLCVLS